jgi:hypothetical protein
MSSALIISCEMMTGKNDDGRKKGLPLHDPLLRIHILVSRTVNNGKVTVADSESPQKTDVQRSWFAIHLQNLKIYRNVATHTPSNEAIRVCPVSGAPVSAYWAHCSSEESPGNGWRVAHFWGGGGRAQEIMTLKLGLDDSLIPCLRREDFSVGVRARRRRPRQPLT